MERDSARAENPSPVCSNRVGFSARANGPENLKKSHVIETEFQPGLKSELGHALSAHFLILLRLFARNFTSGAEANVLFIYYFISSYVYL